MEVTLYLGIEDNRSIWEIEKPWENIYSTAVCKATVAMNPSNLVYTKAYAAL